jgi:lysozyme
VRGVYQYFRPSQDPEDQANLLLNKVKAAGGLQAGDLPPVLDLETDSGLAAATVVARAKAWLAFVESKIGAKPIIYTAAFMSNVIGNNFGAYTLWVANYGATCPLMPSGWTDWKFWQDSQTGSVPGVSGAVDTNFFNGTLTALKTLTVKATPQPPTPPPDLPIPDEEPEDVGDQGATIGSGNPPETASASVDLCH